jgi:hypothetical protein
MSEQPSTFRQEMQTHEEGQRAESAGEWTVNMVQGYLLDSSHNYNNSLHRLTAAINAALDAEREKVEEYKDLISNVALAKSRDDLVESEEPPKAKGKKESDTECE